MGIVQARDGFGVQQTVSERRNGKNKTNEWAGSSDVKECASGTNRGTNQNKRAESPDKRGERNEERIAGANVMMTAGEDMAEFVGEKNGEQGECERQAGGEGRGVLVKQREGFDKLVQGNGLVLRIGDGELGAGDKASAKSEEEKNAREIKGLERRGRRCSHIAWLKKRHGAPIQVDWNGRRWIFWERVSHEMFESDVKFAPRPSHSAFVELRDFLQGLKPPFQRIVDVGAKAPTP